MMYKMIYMGSWNSAICEYIIKMCSIKLVGYIPDPSLSLEKQAEFQEFWNIQKVPEIKLCEEEIKQADFVLVNGYSRIIKSNLIDKYLFINIHAGNLPKWRGTSANSWAILNGDNQIAYTIHKVTERLDEGPIYCKYEYKLPLNQKYGDGRKRLEALLLGDLENVLVNICTGKIKAKPQDGKYVYCSPFKKEDGYIKSWNKNSIDIINLFRVFGTPYGSGLYLSYKGEWYEIMDVCLDDSFDECNLISGAVVYKYNGYIWIKTKDTAVKIQHLKNKSGEVIKAADLLGIGIRL